MQRRLHVRVTFQTVTGRRSAAVLEVGGAPASTVGPCPPWPYRNPSLSAVPPQYSLLMLIIDPPWFSGSSQGQASLHRMPRILFQQRRDGKRFAGSRCAEAITWG